MTDERPVVHATHPLIIRRDADVYRLAAIVLSTLDRAGVIGLRIDRVVVYGQRVILFELPLLDRTFITEAITQHLIDRLAPHRVRLRPRPSGCAIFIELTTNISQETES